MCRYRGASCRQLQGKAYTVSPGKVFRIVQEDKPHIGDVRIFNVNDTSERFITYTTFLREGA